MIRSIRLTLSLWYIGILAIILILFSLALYTSVSGSLMKDVNDVLASHADGIGDALTAFWEAEHSAQPALHIQEDILSGGLPDLVHKWAKETGELENATRPIRIISRTGLVIAESKTFPKLALPLTKAGQASARRKRTLFETFQLPDHPVQLITRPIIEGGQVLFLVQVVSPIRQIDASLERLRRWLLWLVPTTLILASAVGWFLGTLALRPIDQMIRQARQIGIESLHERLGVPQTGDELERLGTTFNHMLDRLENSFKRLRQFSAAASHELRTPLTVLKGELEVALRKSRTVEEYQQVLRTLTNTIDEMHNIVEVLLMFARSEASTRAIEWQQIDVDALTRRTFYIFKKIAEEKKIQLQMDSGGPMWVRGEQRLLERLVTNLLDNALRHTPPGGEVALRVARHGDEAWLIVRDTGPGIPDGELPNIFDRFFGRRVTEGEGASTGLGLGLCRWIAEAHKGKIEVASPPGQGALFTARLPLAISKDEQLVI